MSCNSLDVGLKLYETVCKWDRKFIHTERIAVLVVIFDTCNVHRHNFIQTHISNRAFYNLLSVPLLSFHTWLFFLSYHFWTVLGKRMGRGKNNIFFWAPLLSCLFWPLVCKIYNPFYQISLLDLFASIGLPTTIFPSLTQIVPWTNQLQKSPTSFFSITL